MEYMDQGSLLHILKYRFSSGINDISIIATLIYECAMALQYLHKNNIIHRDLKASNILVDSEGRVCLADLGVIGLLHDAKRRYSFVGSLHWMAPEVFSSSKGYDNKV